MDLIRRAERHAALGDEHRLSIVDQLAVTDLTFAELVASIEIPGNLLAHHLDVLENAGLIHRHASEGDRRRRYISLDWGALPFRPDLKDWRSLTIAFVCTHNSARSQFAAALWRMQTGSPAWSAGSEPAAQVHPKALRVADEFNVEISGRAPAAYDTLPEVDLIISVCDRANESDLPPATSRLHWSVPDPVPVGTVTAFRIAFADIDRRVRRLAGQVAP